MDPALYVIEPAVEAEPVELLQLGHIRGEPRWGAWSLRVGIASRIDEGSRHAAEFTARMPRFDTLKKGRGNPVTAFILDLLGAKCL
ncbi:MAG TPA: hypothetical protein VKM72_08855 [Thermoanaerobaculia bacterium]|nr:hypothetical protein [Thermoanaerobaculia bacterium]